MSRYQFTLCGLLVLMVSAICGLQGYILGYNHGTGTARGMDSGTYAQAKREGYDEGAVDTAKKASQFTRALCMTGRIFQFSENDTQKYRCTSVDGLKL